MTQELKVFLTGGSTSHQVGQTVIRAVENGECAGKSAMCGLVHRNKI
jgi:hypothetical protein